MTLRHLLLVSCVIAIWGFNILMIKVGVQEMPPLLLTGLRFVAVSLLLLPFRPRPPAGKLKLIIALAVVLGVGHFGFLFAGVRGMGAGAASIVLQLGVPFSAVLALALYRERLSLPGWIGMTLALIGIVVINGTPSVSDPTAMIMILLSAFAWGGANIIIKMIGPVDSFALNGWVALFSFPLLLGLSLILEQGQWEAMAQAGWRGWGAVAYTAILASIVSYTIWYYLLGRLPVNRVVPFNLLVPVIAIAGSWLLLDEPVGWLMLLGGALTIFGVAAIQLWPSQLQGGTR